MRSVSDFPDEFLATFERAYVSPVEVFFATQKEANQLRSHLHRLRTSMRAERHPLLAKANACFIGAAKQQEDGRWMLRIQNLGAGLTGPLKEALSR